MQQAYDYQQSQLPPPEAAPSKTAELRERLQKMYDEGDIDENSLSVSTAILDQNDQLGQQQAELQRNAEAQQAQVRQYAESLQTKYEQQEARSQANLLMDWFDTQVMALPKSYEATLGAGSSRELSPTSPAYQARDGVMKAVNTYQRNWEDLGYKSDNDPKIFQDALHKQLGDHAKTTARDNLKDELRKNGRRVTARPTHTDSEPTDRRERALENADNHRLFSRRD